MPARCVPNEDGAVLLKDILFSFNSPIKEEHAWALCYQGAMCFRDAFRYHRDKCYTVTDIAHIWVHRDGTVHSRTIYAGGDTEDSHRRPVKTEKELIFGLGMVIYNALEFGYSYGEERDMSRDIEELIDLMTPEDDETTTDAEPHQETDDEGIERDSGDADEYNPGPSHPSDQKHTHHAPFTLTNILEICARHVDVSTWEQADSHYRAVCRALVAEALELAIFLEKVSTTGAKELRLNTDSDTCRDLDLLNFQDWSNRRIWRALQARFWVQVIGELRMGVKLKKVDYSRTPIEFELTPYEILMDDIRSRRYKLKKIMVDGDIPQRVKKDAHAVILEFIRSRPPLRKVSERKLPPLRKTLTPREQLLDSIKRGRTLKPTPTRNRLKTRLLTPVQNETSKQRREESEEKKPTRRLIKVDFSVLQVDDDDDDDDDIGIPKCASEVITTIGGVSTTTSKGSAVCGRSSPSPWRRTAYDLATQCPTRRASMRRHTLSTCGAEHLLGPPGTQSVPQSRPASRQSRDSSETDSQLGAILPEMSWSRSSLQDELIQSKQWQEAMSLDDRLSLTLEEIVHIRSVLTKAELEALPVEGHVKEDVEKRKVCFLCLKTRFGLFGPWGQKCKLCKRTVCAKCYTKMRIPTEHFSNVPVVLLSPSLMSSPEDDVKESFPRSLVNRLMVPDSASSSNAARNSVGSAPSSPNMQRGLSMCGSSSSAPGSRVESSLGDGPASLQPVSPASTISERRSRMNRARTLARPGEPRPADRLKGMQMIVCYDCKIMVIQIIKSSRTSRSAIRNNAIRNLTLNLSPVY